MSGVCNRMLKQKHVFLGFGKQRKQGNRAPAGTPPPHDPTQGGGPFMETLAKRRLTSLFLF